MDIKRQFNNLSRVEASLPSRDYYCPQIYESELNSIWYKSWIYAGRAQEIDKAGDFKSLRIGTQNILLVRDAQLNVNGFFNTCRHRGSILCREASGNLGSKHISCPYHRWTYAMDGSLVRTPHLNPTEDFDMADYSLYPVEVKEWRGCLFINLNMEGSDTFESTMDPTSDTLDNWPLEDLQLAHSYTNRMACNWKIFWENFVECYHCPGLHPGLCDLVPLYRRSFISPNDEAGWEEHENNPDPKYRGGLKEGGKSWTSDGELQGIQFPDLDKSEIDSAYTYVQNLPSVFLVAHPDYVRIVSILPDGPEHTTIKAEWLLSEESLQQKQFDLSKIVDFGMQVLTEDAGICEINQRGIHSLAHQQGVLMPQEYEIAKFHRWLKDRVNR